MGKLADLQVHLPERVSPSKVLQKASSVILVSRDVEGSSKCLNAVKFPRLSVVDRVGGEQIWHCEE